MHKLFTLQKETEFQKMHNQESNGKSTYPEISMTSMNINEVADKASSLTFQKEDQLSKKQSIKLSKSKTNEPSVSPKFLNDQNFVKKERKQTEQIPDWKSYFTSEEKKFLAYLLSLIPAIGNRIEEKHATWWIKSFGMDKIKIALQVYWQQVEKSKKDSKIPLPISIGAYVKAALNKGTQPCREADRRNKAFAEQFKRQVGWSELTITEKYCRAEELGKEWHYHLPEVVFAESLKSTFENYCSCSYGERQSNVA